MTQKNDLNLLKAEASKIMDDLSQLGKVLTDVGEAKAGEVKQDMDKLLEQEFTAMKKRLESLSGQIAELAKGVDQHVHANPYLYILGAVGLGLLLGKFVAPRSRK